MSVKVNQIDDYAIKQRLAKTDPEALKLVKLLEKHIKNWQDIAQKAISKLKGCQDNNAGGYQGGE